MNVSDAKNVINFDYKFKAKHARDNRLKVL